MRIIIGVSHPNFNRMKREGMFKVTQHPTYCIEEFIQPTYSDNEIEVIKIHCLNFRIIIRYIMTVGT
ncbi:unnamed protein product [Heterobilharzia americana]|nr:unnamed protein product [Heterobilharzia americana]